MRIYGSQIPILEEIKLPPTDTLSTQTGTTTSQKLW